MTLRFKSFGMQVFQIATLHYEQGCSRRQDSQLKHLKILCLRRVKQSGVSAKNSNGQTKSKLWLEGRLGIVVDGTGKDLDDVKERSYELMHGYGL